MIFEDWIKQQPDGYYSSPEIFAAGAASRDAEVAELNEHIEYLLSRDKAWADIDSLKEQQLARYDAEISYLQYRIDELMLEYCPNEMTEEQLANWAAHQRPVGESELPETIRARSTK